MTIFEVAMQGSSAPGSPGCYGLDRSFSGCRVRAVSNSEIAIWVGAVALLFWGVGAYNRMVRLLGDLAQRFGPVNEQFTQRHSLLLKQLDALAPVLASASAQAAPRLDALRAACQQAESACAHARL